MTAPSYLLYGANGYTGELCAREAAAKGQHPVLAGRNAEAVARLAAALDLPFRAFSLDDAGGVESHLGGVGAVLNCAGPFARTAAAMAGACLRAKVHYLDITGEAAVFEALAARDEEARRAGVMLLPGAGFDVVPSDCLAAHLKRRLPSATHLALGFQGLGRMSRGTQITMIENLHKGGLVRRGGRLTRVAAGHKTRVIDFGRGPRTAMTIPWGDVSTAYFSTGIGNIEVYMALPTSMRIGVRLSRFLAPLLAARSVQRLLQRRVRAGAPGPTAAERARGLSLLWGEASDEQGRRVIARLTTPEGYALTAQTAVAIAGRAVAGQAPPGFQTPSKVFGADFILEFAGVSREDNAAPER